MDFNNVESSQLHSVAHGGKYVDVLHVRFHCPPCHRAGAVDAACPQCKGLGTKGIYEYVGVPYAAFNAILEAKSKGLSVGKVFADAVKKPGYRFVFHPHESTTTEQKRANNKKDVDIPEGHGID